MVRGTHLMAAMLENTLSTACHQQINKILAFNDIGSNFSIAGTRLHSEVLEEFVDFQALPKEPPIPQRKRKKQCNEWRND